LPNSWDPWQEVFEEAGYATAAPGWPDDPETIEEAHVHPEVFANKSIGQVADHYQEVIEALDKKPAIIGHSFGGLLTEILAGRGLAAVSVPISPAPFRGVLPLPFSALKSGSPVLRNPANRSRAVPLTYDQFKYGFANTLDDDEAKELYEKYSVPGAGKGLFQAANANLNPWTEDEVDTGNPARGPMLILAGENDHGSARDRQLVVQAGAPQQRRDRNRRDRDDVLKAAKHHIESFHNRGDEKDLEQKIQKAVDEPSAEPTPYDTWV
jgi:non-heme chloroperoxidase